MFDLISDIFSALGKNRLRTFLTGFSMAWGIFMLVILLGCGNGLSNAMTGNYRSMSRNSIMVWPGRTSVPWNGLQAGRRTVIDGKVLEQTMKNLPQIIAASPVRQVWGVTETHGAEYISGGGLYGVTPEYYRYNADMTLLEGRMINELDHSMKRKVAVMHKRNADNLFKGKCPIGEYIVVNSVPYQVIGVYNNGDRDNNPPEIVPLTTLENIYPGDSGYSQVTFFLEGIDSRKQGQEFEQKLRESFARSMNYSPDDHSGVWIWNVATSYYETVGIMKGINAFLWLIGLGTLIAGIVGISNIMLVTVKEKTKEFGIRKALGARPHNIFSLVLTESLMITSVFGYAGMLAGILVLELLGKAFPAADPLAENAQPTVFANPSIDLGVALGAMAILIAAALAAAYIPARKAVEIKPIEALHNE